MNIGIDAHFAAKHKRGIGNYCYHLIQNLIEIDEENLYTLYIYKDDKVDFPLKKNFIVRNLPTNNYLLYEQFYLPIQAKKDKLDILHSLGNTAPIFLSKKIKLIVTIHDVMFMKKSLKLKSLYQKIGKVYRKFVAIFIIKSAGRIISVSQFSRKDIIDTFELRQTQKVSTVLESYDSTVFYRKKAPSRKDCFIFALGAKDPRKNTELIFRVFSKLRKKLNLKLVMTGLSGESLENFRVTCKSLGILEDVEFYGFVTEEKLATFYNSALMFLYPSTYEGFGIPPLEAMACGCPVVTSDVTAIPEIVGNAAILVNPHSEEEVFQACLEILENKALRESKISLGLERVKKFSWKKTALETLRIYNLEKGDRP